MGEDWIFVPSVDQHASNHVAPWLPIILIKPFNLEHLPKRAPGWMAWAFHNIADNPIAFAEANHLEICWSMLGNGIFVLAKVFWNSSYVLVHCYSLSRFTWIVMLFSKVFVISFICLFACLLSSNVHAAPISDSSWLTKWIFVSIICKCKNLIF